MVRIRVSLRKPVFTYAVRFWKRIIALTRHVGVVASRFLHRPLKFHTECRHRSAIAARLFPSIRARKA
jgi:hypothetical protein